MSEHQPVTLTVLLPSPVVSIEISLPPRELSANSGRASSRLARASAVKRYRAEAGMAFLLARKRAGVVVMEAATVRVTFYWPDHRRRDPDNAAASLKAVWDGAQDAKLFRDDRGLVHLPPVYEVDGRRPRLRVQVFDCRVEFVIGP